MGTRAIDLQTGGAVTPSIRVDDYKALSAVTVEASWGTAVVEVQHSLDDTTWAALPVAAEMDSTTPQITNRGIFGSLFIRFRTKTLDAGASAAAVITFKLL